MSTNLRIAIRLFQVVNHLVEKLLRFILSCDILEGHLFAVLLFIFAGV